MNTRAGAARCQATFSARRYYRSAGLADMMLALIMEYFIARYNTIDMPSRLHLSSMLSL